MGDVWITADTHFGHKNVIEYCNRPFSSVEEMDDTLINNWNSVVKPEDVVYHLGDFALCSRERIRDILSILNGTKVLILGNHDRYPISFYISAGFTTAIHKSVLFGDNILMSHFPPKREIISHRFMYLFGHTHDKPAEVERYTNCLCVCCDRTNFTPISSAECLRRLNRQTAGFSRKLKKSIEEMEEEMLLYDVKEI